MTKLTPGSRAQPRGEAAGINPNDPSKTQAMLVHPDRPVGTAAELDDAVAPNDAEDIANVHQWFVDVIH